MKKTLHLNLIRQWFNMIKSKHKKEEYRDITPYWCARFLTYGGVKCSVLFWKNVAKFKNLEYFVIHWLKYDQIQFIHFDTITFSNGYAKNRDQFEVELKGISINIGNTFQGAIPGKKYFILDLGKIIEP